MFNLYRDSMFTFLLIMLFTFSATAYPNTEGGATSDPDTLNHYVKHRDKLAPLVEYIEKAGLKIDDKLQDSRFEIYEGISNRFKRSAEKKSLDLEAYKKIIGFDNKKERIIDFIHLYNEHLKQAEQTYDIPLFVISAIIGLESDFGRVTGNYNPFNVYVSMYAENYRESFAKAQLKELLIFSEKNNIDVFELKSSYAGAMTFAQFIPYSMNKWFVGNDIFDMDNNIRSVANYLSYFKQRSGSLEEAVLRYNPSSLYTKAVLDLAGEAEKYFSATPK